MSTRVIVGLSGGVDSSVAAHRLIEAGYDVHAVFMKNWDDEQEGTDDCSVAQDLSDARSVAQKLGIPLSTVNFTEDYLNRVFHHFLEAYRAGLTPNPDVLCNQEIKFKAFLEHALSLGADKIATGHYAGLTPDSTSDQVLLTEAVDASKDQTYFLYRVPQAALQRALFPLSDIPKSSVRSIAKSLGLATHNKKDSTGICFIGERKFREFLSTYLPAKPGAIESPTGEVLGEHQGLMYYTLGQRQGLCIGGRRGSSGEPWFVLHKDLTRNVLIAGQGYEHPWLYSQACGADDLCWIAGTPPATRFSAHAKVRYRQTAVPCEVHVRDDKALVRFMTPERAVTPGQSIVLYHENNCLGGGIIKSIDAPREV